MNNIEKAFKAKREMGLRAGSGTADDVPIMASEGEYMMPADTVKAVGVDKLDALKDATHTPTGRGLRAGVPHMADGGFVGKLGDAASYVGDKFQSLRGGIGADPLPAIDPSLAGSATPVPSAAPAPAATTAPQSLRGGLTPNTANPNILAGGQSPEAAAYQASRAAPLPAAAEAAPNSLRMQPVFQDGIWKGVKQVGGGAGIGVGGALQAAQAYGQSAALGASDTPGSDRLALAGEQAGRFAGSVLGAQGGAALGAMTGPLAPVMAPALGLAGGAAGYFAPDAVKKATDYIGLTDKATQLPSDKANALIASDTQNKPASAPIPPTGLRSALPALPDNAAGKNYDDPSFSRAQSDAVFNSRLARSGAGDASLTTDAQGNRILGNSKDAPNPFDTGLRAGGLYKQDINVQAASERASRDAQEVGLQAHYAQEAQQAARQVSLRAGSGAPSADTSAIDAQIRAANAAGRPGLANQLLQTRSTMVASANDNATRLRAQDIASADTQRGQDLTSQNARSVRQFEGYKMNVEQNNKNREFGQKVSQETFTNKQAAEKSLNDQILQAHTTTVDGKPVIDNEGANATRLGLDTMVRGQIADLKRSGSPADLARAQNLSENDIHAMSPDVKTNAIDAVRLMNKVNGSASNINPFKPDPLASSDPRDYLNMKKNADGDFVTGKGQVIPRRFMDKKNADFFLGQPTNEFDGLKAGFGK